MHIVICYDISDDKRRRKVVKILEGAGYRVQYSVFECDLTGKELRKIQKRLKPLVKDKRTESIRFYPLVSESEKRIEVIGLNPKTKLADTLII